MSDCDVWEMYDQLGETTGSCNVYAVDRFVQQAEMVAEALDNYMACQDLRISKGSAR